MAYRLPLLTTLIVALSLPAQAAVYRHVDAQGNVTFSDEPTQGAQEIQVKPVTTVTLPKPDAVREQLQRQESGEDQGPAYDQVGFSFPSDEEAFHSGSGDVEFRVQSSPALRRGHKFEVTLDGQPVGQTTSGAVAVQNIDRGTHRAGVHVINQSGQRVQSGDEITFTIHRPSQLNRN